MSVRAIAIKEFRDVVREKSIVTAFAIQFFLAGFSALLLVGLTALHSPDAIASAPEAAVAYSGPGGLLPYVEATRNLDVLEMPPEEALAAFRDGRIAMVIQERYPDEEGLRRITVILADGELQSTLLITQLKSVLIDYETALRQERIDRLDIEYVPDPIEIRARTPYGFVYSTLLPLLVVTPVFLSGAIAGDALSQESRSRTLLILRSTPISTPALVAGKLVVPVLLVPIQVMVWLALFALNGFVSADPLAVVLFATMLGLFITGTGGIIAALVRDESSTQAAYAVLVLAIGVFSLLLPRDPLNVIALLSTGVADGAAWRSIAYLGVASIAGVVAAMVVTSRRIRRDLL